MTPFNAFRRPLTVTRKQAGSYDDNGLYVEGSTSSLTIQASVQPLTGEVLQALPEAQRTLEGYTLYTDSTLNVASQDAGTTADLVTIGGVAFDVQRQQAWGNGIINHNVYVIQKVAE